MEDTDGAATAVDRIEEHLDRIEQLLREIRWFAAEMRDGGDDDGRVEGPPR